MFNQYVDQTKNEAETDIKGFPQSKKPEINEVRYSNPLDVLRNIAERIQPLNLYSEQQQDGKKLCTGFITQEEREMWEF